MNTATTETQTQAEREELLASIRNDADGRIYPRLSEELRDDREITEAAVRANPYLYMYSSDRLRNDRDLAMVAVQEYHGNYKYVSADLQESDKELAERAYAGYENNVRYMGYQMREHITQMQNTEPTISQVEQQGPSLAPMEVAEVAAVPQPLEMEATNENVIAQQPKPIGTESDIHAIARARLEAERSALEASNKAHLHASVIQMEAEPIANAENKWFMGQYRAYQREVMEDGFKRDFEASVHDLNDRHQMLHDNFRRAESHAHIALREAQENPSPENAEKYFRAFATERMAQAEYAPGSVSNIETEKCKALLASDSQNFYQSLNEWDAVRAPDTKTAIQSQAQLNNIRVAESKRAAPPQVDAQAEKKAPDAKKFSELVAERHPEMKATYAQIAEIEKELRTCREETASAIEKGDRVAEHNSRMKHVDKYFEAAQNCMQSLDECHMRERRYSSEMALRGRPDEQQQAEAMSAKIKANAERGYKEAVTWMQACAKGSEQRGDLELRDKANGKIFELEKLHKDQTERHALRDEQERAEHRAQSRGQTNAVEQTAPGVGVKF